jgi:indole-3-glycerol phosphate synthase
MPLPERRASPSARSMPSLDRQISSSRRAVEERRGQRPLSELEQLVDDLGPIRPFTESVMGEEISFVLRCPKPDFELAEAAEAGVVGLTSESDDELATVTAESNLPVLHRALIVDPYQLYEARLGGAGGVVLLAAAFEDEDEHFLDLQRVAAEIGLDVIVEVAREEDIEHTLDLLDPDSFLVRNRDGQNGTVDFERTFSMLEEVPAGKVVLSQGGIRTRDQAAALEGAGVDAAVLGRWIWGEGLRVTLDILRGDTR